MIQTKYVIGIDEAGRGPLAGPVAVGAVVMLADDYEKLRQEELFPAGKDSKKLTPKKRAECYRLMLELKKAGRLDFRVVFGQAKEIDRLGISQVIRESLASVLGFLARPTEESFVLLDGGLSAPIEYGGQETIIRGDESELIIALASIAAKVTRDVKMVELARDYPDYGFEIHKGYGTAKHMEAIRRCGQCPIHRKTFIHL